MGSINQSRNRFISGTGETLLTGQDKGTHIPVGLQSEDLEGRWDDHPLHLVVWGWNTLKQTQKVEGLLASVGLVWQHTYNTITIKPWMHLQHTQGLANILYLREQQ